MGSISPPEWKIDLPQKSFFTFETKAPKIVQEKWEVLPPRMENQCASNLFFIFETKAPKIVQETMGSISR